MLAQDKYQAVTNEIAVTVGVMWAADVVYGYAQEAKGKESKRVTEAISDWVLDTAKQ